MDMLNRVCYLSIFHSNSSLDRVLMWLTFVIESVAEKMEIL